MAEFDFSLVNEDAAEKLGLRIGRCSGCHRRIINVRDMDGVSMMVDFNWKEHKKVCTGKKTNGKKRQ